MNDCIVVAKDARILSGPLLWYWYIMLDGKVFDSMVSAAVHVKHTLLCSGDEAIHYVQSLPRVRSTY